jgi:hypothetical protein
MASAETSHRRGTLRRPSQIPAAAMPMHNTRMMIMPPWFSTFTVVSGPRTWRIRPSAADRVMITGSPMPNCSVSDPPAPAAARSIACPSAVTATAS